MRGKFSVTYDIVTHESAEHGATADSGFIEPGERRRSCDGLWGEAAGKLKDECAMRLRDAINLLSYLESDGNGRYYEVDGRQNYQTGEHESRALHAPDNATPSTLARIERLLRKERLLLS